MGWRAREQRQMRRQAEEARKGGLFEPGAAQTARSRGPVVAAFDPALQQVRSFAEVWRAHRDTEEGPERAESFRRLKVLRDRLGGG